MYVWTVEGTEQLSRQAADYAQAAAQSGARDYDEAFVQRMNFFASRAESAIEKLLPELIEHADPFWPPLPPKREVPDVEEPSRREVAKRAGPPPEEPEREDFRTRVPEPGLLGGLFGGRHRYDERVRRARADDEENFGRALRAYQEQVERWEARMEQAREELVRHQEEARTEAEEYNEEIEKASRLRADPTAEFLSKVATSSVLRTLFAAMSNLSLPLPGPDLVESRFRPARKVWAVDLHLPEEPIVVPPARFTLEDGEPKPVPRGDEESSHLYTTYAAALVVGAAHVVRALMDEGELDSFVKEIVASAAVAQDGSKGEPNERRYVASIRVSVEEAKELEELADDPLAGLSRLGGRLAENIANGERVEPYDLPAALEEE